MIFFEMTNSNNFTVLLALVFSSCADAFSMTEYDEKINIRVFTRNDPTIGRLIKVLKPSSLDDSGFNSSLPTVIITHGWISDEKEGLGGPFLRDGLLQLRECNVLLVDWSKVDSINYLVARWRVPYVGQFIGQLLRMLRRQGGLQFKDLHLIGHSLGAHVMGFAGRNASMGNQGRITGLDPAGPLFGSNPKYRLDRTDAGFVDVIHTCGWVDGYFDPIGDVDFYPNGGHWIQPGCGFDIGTCSHCRAYLYMIQSMDPAPFIGTRCSSYEDYKKGDCKDNPTANMGEPVDSSARGKYYLETNKSSPFSKNATTPGAIAQRTKGLLTHHC